MPRSCGSSPTFVSSHPDGPIRSVVVVVMVAHGSVFGVAGGRLDVAEDVPQSVGYLADGHARRDRLDNTLEDVPVAASRHPDRLDGRRGLVGVTLRPDPLGSRYLPVDLLVGHLQPRRFVDGLPVGVPVLPDPGDLAALYLPLALVSLLADHALCVTLGDGPVVAAVLVDPVNVGPDAVGHLVGQRLDEVRLAQRVDHVGGVRLLQDDVLGVHGDPRGLLAGRPERLLVRVGV